MTSSSALLKFYFAFRSFNSFNFCLLRFLIKQKILEEVLFKYTCRPSWRVLPAVKSSYSVENLLAPVSDERNFTVDVMSGVLKTRKAESCSLHVCKSLPGKFLYVPKHL